MTTINAHFDGKVFVPDEPVDLPVGAHLRVHVERVRTETTALAGKVTPAPRKWQPLNIQIDPDLSNAIALDPEFNIEES
jgi:hypothetical protein